MHEITPKPQSAGILPSIDGNVVEGGEKSFQAKIFRLGDRIAKVYDRMHLYGLVDLRDDSVRQELMKRELTCLSSLSPGLEARIEPVKLGDGSTEAALTMRCLQPTDFLDCQLATGRVPTPEALTRLAKIVADFHFDPTCAPQARLDHEGLCGFLTARLEGMEAELREYGDTDQIEAAQKTLLDDIFLRAKVAVTGMKSELLHMQEELSEPVIGHGDLKTQNLAITEQQEIFVLDSAPYSAWQINTRGMDAAFLRVELQLLGHAALADHFRDAHRSACISKLAERQIDVEKMPTLDAAVRLTEEIGGLLRAAIFYRLTFLGVDPERRDPALQLMRSYTDRAVQIACKS